MLQSPAMKRLVSIALTSCLALACGDDTPPGDTSDTADTHADSADTADTAPDTTTADLVDTSPDAPDDTTPADAAPDDGDGTAGCSIPEDASDPATTPFLRDLGCASDFEALASEPLDASIPGARSLKTVFDRVSGQALYFQNSKLYPIHYDFCRAHLSGQGKPIVGDLGTFNASEYFTPSRRFILGAVTWYSGPGVWVYEIAPYDTASAALVETAFDAVRAHAFFGGDLRFHATSAAVAKVADQLPADIPRITTDQLFAGIDYQPLNLASAMGTLRFVEADALDTSTLSFRDIIVLDYVPNDIAVVSGIVTDQLQTPLSHINVLSQNRGTPNMGLRGAWTNEALRALEGTWVELTVGAFDWHIREVTEAEADAWWESHRPPAVGVPAIDLAPQAVIAIDDLLGDGALGDAIDDAIPAYGGKATHYAALRRVTVTDGTGENALPVEPALAIPVWFYDQHMRSHGLYDVAQAMLADPDFKADAHVRKARLEAFQQTIIDAPLDPDALAEVLSALETLPRQRCRFRSSTNAEDLDGFTGAGLYTSMTGDPYDADDPVDVAMKTVWASVWRYKAFEEREYRSISHDNVGMAILVSPSFPDEVANGVAITANLFSAGGIEPGFVVNVQKGDVSVVLPPKGVTSDYLVYYWYYPNQPETYLSHSNVINPGATVLSRTQLYRLGQELDAVHRFFAPVYQHSGAFYGMDVEFKLDVTSQGALDIIIKQARPHPGWGFD